MASGTNGIFSNETNYIRIEKTGLKGLADYLTAKEDGTLDTWEWVSVCPDTLNNKVTRATVTRNPLCFKGVVTVVTGKSLDLAFDGYLKVDNDGERYIWEDEDTLDTMLIEITDIAYGEDEPKIYVGEYATTDLAFAVSGGDLRLYSYTGSAGNWERVDNIDVVVPQAG